MNSKLLKLDAPYKVIYAGGRIGHHIATLITWSNDQAGADDDAEIFEAHEYPVIDQGEEYPAGTLIKTDLEDCRVVCTYNPKTGITGTNIYWLASIIEYDFKQLEPSGAEYILDRLQRLGCQVKLRQVPMKDEEGKPLVDKHGRPLKDENGEPMVTDEYDYDANLYISLTRGHFEKDPQQREYIVKSPSHQALYFESAGTADEIYSDLSYQLSVYSHYLLDDIGCVKFETEDMLLADVLNRLNKRQGIETNYKDLF